MISDAEILRAVSLVAWRFAGSSNGQLDYEIRDLRLTGGQVDFELVQRDGHHARVALNLPSSGLSQPWLYAPPDDASDWVGQMLTWLDEEVFTGGLGDSRTRDERDGASYVAVVPYGWRRSDSERHEELLEAAGPDGWYGNVLDQEQES